MAAILPVHLSAHLGRRFTNTNDSTVRDPWEFGYLMMDPASMDR